MTVWPVANLGKDGWEGPTVEPATGRITGWHTDMPLFKFPINWNGFSFNTLQLADRALFQVCCACL